MAGYYDYVLAAIPVTLLGLGGGLVVVGLSTAVAVTTAAVVSLGVVGHAMFVRAPVTASPATAAPDADAPVAGEGGSTTAD